MRVRPALQKLSIIITVVCTSAFSVVAQQPSPTPGPEVIRVNTSLVQTDVMVFDKQGKFIDNLTREQFVLKVDGKPRDISFFELVKAGSANEESQLAAARGMESKSGTPRPLDRGRSIFFFLDDLHLSEESMKQTRKMLSDFVERQFGQNDQLALITATGQLGFLQQLTDNKTVLKTAIERLRAQPYKNLDIQNPPMSEYQALRIDSGDRDVLDVFVERVMLDNPNMNRARAEQEVRTRATSILRMAGGGITRTMTSLQWIMDKFRPTPGRKVVFFLSDGFVFDHRNSDIGARMNNVIAGAAKAGFVIYSIDARGLVTGVADASTEVIPDPTGRLSRGTMGETNAFREVMNALASDTGGKAFYNNNDPSISVTKGLNDASTYYLLAWRPEANEERNPKLRRLEVSIISRPELVVRSRSRVGDIPEAASKKPATAPEPAQNARVADVKNALEAVAPAPGFPVDLTLNSINTAEKGDQLVLSIGLSTAALRFQKKAEASVGALLLSAVVLNDKGKVLDSFNKRLTVQGKSGQEEVQEDITYTHFLGVKPGLYQVRVVAADEQGGPTGSAWEWIEITDLSNKQLALSSLQVGERKPAPITNASDSSNRESDRQVGLNIARRFAPSSYLRFVTIVYNAASGPAAKPDLAVQIQVFRDNEPVLTDPLHRISTDGATDLARVSYAAELNLNELTAGKYVLQLTVIDRIAKATASQRYRFQVD